MNLDEKKIQYQIACTRDHFGAGRVLFKAYAASLKVDLSFQDFDTELQNLESQYGYPGGALLLLYINGVATGCIALRKLDEHTAELKRMFILPAYRGSGLGWELLNRIIDTAGELGYKKIRLDTLPDMVTAQQLYEKSGFYKINAYRFNPVKGTLYMEKELSANKEASR